MPPGPVLTPVSEDLPNVFFVAGQNGGRYPNCHCLLISPVGGGAGPILVDTGMGRRTLLKILRKHPISRVLLSHWHEDHTYGNKILIEHGAGFSCHPLDLPVIQNVELLQDYYLTKGTSVGDLFKGLLKSLDLVSLETISLFEDGQQLGVGAGQSIQVLHTPGHSAGHCCFYLPEERVLFLGDIDLSGLGPWYGAKDSDLGDFKQSIERVLGIGADYAISGHKGLFPGRSLIKAELRKFRQVIVDRDQRVLGELSENVPKTVGDLVGKSIIYKRYGDWKDYLFIAEQRMIAQHLSLLAERGKVSQQAGGYVLA